MEQKKFDYNSFIGMILLGAIMLWYFSENKPEIEPEKSKTEQVENANVNTTSTVKHTETPVVLNDSLQQVAAKNKLGAFAYSSIGKQETKVLENELLKLTIDTKGGQIVKL